MDRIRNVERRKGLDIEESNKTIENKQLHCLGHLKQKMKRSVHLNKIRKKNNREREQRRAENKADNWWKMNNQHTK